MWDALRHRWDYNELPASLVRYLIAVTILGPVAVLSCSLLLPHGSLTVDWLLCLILGAMAGVAERFPVHLAHRTHANVATAVYIAMFLSLPLGTCLLLILVSTCAAQAARLASDDEMGLSEPLFNAGQTALYTTATAIAIWPIMIATDDHASFNVLVGLLASACLHIGNTLLVAGAASRHLDLPFMRVWSQNLTIDIGPHVAMTLIGFVAAELAVTQPLLIPVLAIPVVLIHRAVKDATQLREDTHASLASLAEIIELRDPYTAGHSRRVATTARLLALELGLSAEEADEIEAAGEVHDLGKVAVDPAILGKPGKLTPEEWDAMKLHPVYGAEVVGRFSTYRSGVAYVRAHHESMDGSGYPDQLIGQAIPLGARILAVADTFDALTSDRPYRSGMPIDRAREILTSGSGSQWDPAIVEALIRLLEMAPNPVPVHQSVDLICSPNAA